MFEPQERELLQKILERYQRALVATLPSKEELQSVTISEKTERKMSRLFFYQKHFYYTWINTAAKRVACFLAALLLAAAITTASVEALREGFVRFIIDTFEKGSTVWFSKEDAGMANTSPITPKIPAYLPEAYKLVADMSDEYELDMLFERNETESLSYRQIPKGSKINVNTEEVTPEKIFISNAFEGIIFQNNNSTFLIFNDGEYMYILIGTVPKEEILKIAESIPMDN